MSEVVVVLTEYELEAAFDPLLRFRKWVRETDEITDHDLLVTAKQIAITLGIRVE